MYIRQITNDYLIVCVGMKGLGCVRKMSARRMEMLSKKNLGLNNDFDVRGGGIDLNKEKSCIPEIIYAVDCNFISEDNSRSIVLKEIVKEFLLRFNLQVSEEKIEQTTIKKDEVKQRSGNG